MQDRTRQDAVKLYDAFTHGSTDRRTFMASLTKLAGGAAAANLLLTDIAAASTAAPLVAADDPRLLTRIVDWEPRSGRKYRGYQAQPRRRRNMASILVVHENRGLNEHIRDVARRLAVAGYSALAVDFLSSAGGTPADEDQARRMIGELNMPEVVADGAATVAWLGTASGARRKVGVIGFCWGGAMVHRIALAAGSRLSAGVSFYGPAPEPAEVAKLQTPLLVHLAGRDERVNRTALPYVAAAEAAGKPVRAITYPDVDHAFHNDTSAQRYNRAAAERAWAETMQFFRRHLR